MENNASQQLRNPSSSPHLNLPPNNSVNPLSIQTIPSVSSHHLYHHLDSAAATPSRTIYSDRFIPSRSSSNFALFHVSPLPSSAASAEGREDGSGTYSALLRTVLFGPDSDAVSPATPDRTPGHLSSRSSPSSGGSTPSRNIFRFKTETRKSLYSLSPVALDGALPGVIPSPPKTPRKVPRSPFKVTKLCDLGADDNVCSVGWAQRGTHLAVGTNQGKVQIWDASRCRRVRTMDGHRMRVGALAWSSSLLSSGGRDKTILQRDIRAQEDSVSKLLGHKSEVCGLKWSYDNRELASGGNDNRLFVWNQHSTQPVLKYCEHTAAVKAIAWSPHLHGLLASGGGTADRCIRFWNTTSNSHLSCVDTGSQVASDLRDLNPVLGMLINYDRGGDEESI
ncbi:B-type cell cycle switch protein ccs52A [Asimina triloba]